MGRLTTSLLIGSLALSLACAPPPAAEYDVLIRGGTVYDGSGTAPVVADLAISDELVVGIGDFSDATAAVEVDASGHAVAPGFINMLSWATEDLLVDGRSLGDIRQGVTLEVFGEGWSMGPINEDMRARMIADQGDLRFDVPWTTLGEYLDHMVEQGVAPNVASYIGATTVRIHELGEEDRPPTAEELARMQELVREAMREGALGVGSSLIYPPAFYAETEELIALARAAGEFGGAYISHMRSEGNRLLEGIEELITIAREAGVPAEIYHLKQAGTDNWNKLDAVIERVERARADGLRITADMYTYPAGSTGLDASMPPWVAEGGDDAMMARLRDPATRARLIVEMSTPTDEWENLLLSAGSPDRVLLVGFRQDSLKYLTGSTLVEVAELRGTGIEETAMDLVIQDNSRVGTVYFMMDEENVARQIAIPWVSFGSDGGSMAPEEPFTLSSTHPRAYGNFARLLGRYVRDEGVIPLEEAIRKLTSLPASNLQIEGRGRLAPGFAADVVIFDPATIRDVATFEEPHQLAEGVRDVFVNGVAVLRGGDPTGATPGQVVRGPGWTGGGRD
jgi:N-acyl-D-amino-acid deacylase